eukprot:11912041-Alexandrium_andersonii.AAC.1
MFGRGGVGEAAYRSLSLYMTNHHIAKALVSPYPEFKIITHELLKFTVPNTDQVPWLIKDISDAKKVDFFLRPITDSKLAKIHQKAQLTLQLPKAKAKAEPKGKAKPKQRSKAKAKSSPSAKRNDKIGGDVATVINQGTDEERPAMFIDDMMHVLQQTLSKVPEERIDAAG